MLNLVGIALHKLRDSKIDKVPFLLAPDEDTIHKYFSSLDKINLRGEGVTLFADRKKFPKLSVRYLSVIPDVTTADILVQYSRAKPFQYRFLPIFSRMSRIPLIHQVRVPLMELVQSSEISEPSASVENVIGGAQPAPYNFDQTFEQDPEGTTSAVALGGSVAGISSAGSSPLSELLDSSSVESTTDVVGVPDSISKTEPELLGLTPKDFSIYVHPFESYPVIKSHLHPKFVILQTGIELDQMDLFARDNLLRQHPLLVKIYKLSTAWRSSYHVPEKPDEDQDFKGGGRSDGGSNAGSERTLPGRFGRGKGQKRNYSDDGASEGSSSKQTRLNSGSIKGQRRMQSKMQSEDGLSQATLVDHHASVGEERWSTDKINSWAKRAMDDTRGALAGLATISV
jgi:hypothetical protein